MYKKTLILSWLILAVVAGHAHTPAVRQPLHFDAGWKFHLGSASDPKQDFNYGISNIFSKSGQAGNTCISPRYNDSSWENVQLPHDWAVTLPFQYVKNGDI